jgi:hypothetical protein
VWCAAEQQNQLFRVCCASACTPQTLPAGRAKNPNRRTEAEGESFYDAQKREMAARAAATAAALSELDPKTRLALAGHGVGSYVRIRLTGARCHLRRQQTIRSLACAVFRFQPQTCIVLYCIACTIFWRMYLQRLDPKTRLALAGHGVGSYVRMRLTGERCHLRRQQCLRCFSWQLRLHRFDPDREKTLGTVELRVLKTRSGD